MLEVLFKKQLYYSDLSLKILVISSSFAFFSRICICAIDIHALVPNKRKSHVEKLKVIVMINS